MEQVKIIKDVEISLCKTGIMYDNYTVRLKLRAREENKLTVFEMEFTQQEIFGFILGNTSYKDLTIKEWDK